LKENDYLKRTNSAREDETLNIMEQLDELAEENKKLKVWLEEQRTVLNQKKDRANARIQASSQKKEKLVLERNSLIRDLPGNFVTLYNRVYSRRNCRAVVPIVDGICQECHISIPPQMYNELQKNDELMTCPHCDRIIYWQDHADFENIT
jgi:predicted  nucleic acid-binding Zn-ribbon protein